MNQAGEVHCYLCGEVSGTWEWPAAASPEFGWFRPRAAGRPAPVGSLRSLRCGRCGGPVYLDDVAPVKARDPLALSSLPAPRRGRPPKSQPLAS